MNRRSAGLLSAAAILAACSAETSPSTEGTLPAQILADVSGALSQLATVVPSLLLAKVLTAVQESPLLADINTAEAFMATIGPTTAAQIGVSTLARAEAYLNAVLNALVILPLPSPYALIVTAASIIAASLENYLTTLIPTPLPTPAAARVAKRGHAMTLEEARKVLKIQTVS